jgi:hypothetical protein
MKIKLLTIILLSITTAFQIKPTYSKPFPKISYTNIHDISYYKPIYIRRKRPHTFNIICQLYNYINNYIDEVYALASIPLSYNFISKLNTTYN